MIIRTISIALAMFAQRADELMPIKFDARFARIRSTFRVFTLSHKYPAPIAQGVQMRLVHFRMGRVTP